MPATNYTKETRLVKTVSLSTSLASCITLTRSISTLKAFVCFQSTEHELLDDYKEKVESSSSSDSEPSVASTSKGSTVKEVAHPVSSRRQSLAESASLTVESSPKLQDTDFVEGDAFEVAEDVIREGKTKVSAIFLLFYLLLCLYIFL